MAAIEQHLRPEIVQHRRGRAQMAKMSKAEAKARSRMERRAAKAAKEEGKKNRKYCRQYVCWAGDGKKVDSRTGKPCRGVPVASFQRPHAAAGMRRGGGGSWRRGFLLSVEEPVPADRTQIRFACLLDGELELAVRGEEALIAMHADWVKQKPRSGGMLDFLAMG